MKRKTWVTFDHKLTFATTRPYRRGRWILTALAFPLIAGMLAYELSQELATNAPTRPPSPTTEAQAPTATAQTSASKRVDIDYVVRPNDTLEQIFRLLKLNAGDLAAVLAVAGAPEKLRQLKPGEKLTFSQDNGALFGLERRLSDTEIFSVVRAERGFGAKTVATPTETRTAQVRGTINSSLFVAGRAAGLTPEIILQLANDVFGWDVDFALGVRPGDRFNIIYEQKYRDDEYVGDGRIVAAEFINDGEIHRAVHYVSADGKINDYFTPDARALRRQFLRTPIDFTRVSASFNPARRHPVLHTMQAHQGLDYPAPVGTAVKATADGRVSFAGSDNDYGKVIVIDHGGGVSTLYGHLSAFVQGLHADQQLRQGDVIAYVGSSGAATAPHLHYEYRINGTYTDPHSLGLSVTARIPTEYLADFRSKSAALLTGLEGPGAAIVAASLAD